MKILYNECTTNSLGGSQMQEQLHSNISLPQVQKLFGQILEEVKIAYDIVVPPDIRQRRNIDLQKQQDVVIIAVFILGKMLGFTSERSWHAFVKANLFCGQPFPERSRYHRCCRQLTQIIKRIRNFLTERFSKKTSYSIIDSVPLPLCHAARIPRVRRMKGIADKGYCASKKEYYYGFKGSFQVTDEGFVTNYVISKASTHDVQVAEELIEPYPHSYILADKGYVSSPLRDHLKENLGVHLLAQPRSNSKRPFSESLSKLVRSKRKQIETLFSGLIDTFHLTRIRAMSSIGFELALEGILLAHTLLVHFAISSHGNGMRWKSLIFS
jgi:Transposase DDE domain